MIVKECRPTLARRLPWPPPCFRYLPMIRESTNRPSLSESSSAIRSSPQLGFSCAIFTMSVRRFLGSGGRPACRDLQRQNRRNPARCQRTNVSGLTIARALAQGKNRLSITKANFAAEFGRRDLALLIERQLSPQE